MREWEKPCLPLGELPWCLLYREAQGTRGGPHGLTTLLEVTCEVTHDAGNNASLLERSEVTHDGCTVGHYLPIVPDCSGVADSAVRQLQCLLLVSDGTPGA